jgi:hypothetical protein
LWPWPSRPLASVDCNSAAYVSFNPLRTLPIAATMSPKGGEVRGGMTASHGGGIWPLRLAAAAMVLVPICIVAHELGHLLTALALGFPNPEFHFSAVSPGDVSGQQQWELGAVGLAGPLVTALLTVLGIVAQRRWPRSVWPFALAIAAASRFAVAVPFSLVNIYVRLTGQRLQPPAFDEQKAADALGWSGELLLAFTSALLLIVIAWLVVKLPNRWVSLPAILVGTAAGWMLWMGALGPALFP